MTPRQEWMLCFIFGWTLGQFLLGLGRAFQKLAEEDK